ncbi:GIY-YIG nuclease family protein [Fictibacillus nanhaiensis]|uniref:GIY-YIG nuclease family protein n=1 Tax=Fictibacillus nanhaiensis TaxID=742169 RepID=A0ABS2ZTD7_9BACL|nr:GIY-YIG nuclease family protein [Fictibacillus nanhaiensis]
MIKYLVSLFKSGTKTPSTGSLHLYQQNQSELQKIINTPYPRGQAIGYVFFVQDHQTGNFQIGKTTQLDKRNNRFTVNLPFKNELIYLVKSGNHHQTEAAFHDYFTNKRVHGEWYTLSSEDLTWLRTGNYSRFIEDTINHKGIIKEAIDSRRVPLTPKQEEYAKSLIHKLEHYEMVSDEIELSKKDLDRLIMYFKFKNKGTIVNMVKEGILKEKSYMK